MATKRLDELTDINDLIGMVLTEEEKKETTFEDIENVFKRLNGPILAASYCADRLFGFIRWGDEAFYD